MASLGCILADPRSMTGVGSCGVVGKDQGKGKDKRQQQTVEISRLQEG
jgi:hypothetical protein